MFRTPFNLGDTSKYDMPTGEPYDITYKYVIDPKTGRRKWKENGKTNRYEKIQASLEDTKLVNIIKRATTDPSVLNAMNGQWVDVTEMPKSLMEAQNMVIKCRNQFEDLPLDVRKKFDYDADLYVSMYGTKEWAEALGYNAPMEVQKAVKENIKTKEVANNE